MKRDREDDDEVGEEDVMRTKRAKLDVGDEPVWEAYYDENERKFYYYNVRTEETTWDKPDSTSIDYVDEIPEETEEVSHSMSISPTITENQNEDQSSSSSSSSSSDEDIEDDREETEQKTLDIRPDQPDAILEPTFKGEEVINFRGVPASIRLLSSWLDMTTSKKKSSENVIVESLCNKIRQIFSTENLEHLLNSQTPPSWIEDLINADFSSQLLLDLSLVHPKNLILNYAVRRVLEKNEINSNTRLNGVESTVETFFDTYVKVLKDLLLNLARVENEKEYEKNLNSIVSVASHDLHTHMYTVAVLDRLVSQEKDSSWWRAVRERLQRDSIEEEKSVTLDVTMTRLYAKTSPKLVRCLANILKRGHSESSEIAEIRKLLEVLEGTNENDLEPVRDIIVYLIKQIANPFQRLSEEHRKNICWIVSLVSSSSSSSSSSNKLNEKLCSLSNLCNNQRTIHEAKGSSELILSIVLPLIDTPATALCVLSWIRQVWFSSRTTNNRFVRVTCVDVFLEIMMSVIEKHSRHHQDVFEILTKSFTFETKIKREDLMKVRKRTMSRMIYALTLPSYGSRFATRTLDFVSSRASQFDRSELRHFVMRITNVMTGTGISVEMARAVVRLFEEKNVKKSLKFSEANRARVESLLKTCMNRL